MHSSRSAILAIKVLHSQATLPGSRWYGWKRTLVRNLGDWNMQWTIRLLKPTCPVASDSTMSNPVKGCEIIKGTFLKGTFSKNWLLHINLLNYIFFGTLIVIFFLTSKNSGGARAPPCPSPCYGPVNTRSLINKQQSLTELESEKGCISLGL